MKSKDRAETMTAATPAAMGFRMPAEWEPHHSTWFTWPRPDGISFPDKYDAVPPVYADLIRCLIQFEEVNINVWDSEVEETVRKILESLKVPLERVHFYPFRAYEPWCRDHGPVFLVCDRGQLRERAVVDWGYNAWGNKYPPFDLDDAIPREVAKLRQLPLFSPKMILEGGSIEVNGKGLLLTTESCLLNPNRNPDLSRSQIEKFLMDYLGVSKILWLGEGIAGDDTDGHIDDLSRFVDPETVVTVVEEDPQDENFSLLMENLERLRTFTDTAGRPLHVVPLPSPGKIEYQGQRLPASYANFYIANEQVLVPTYRSPNDQITVATLQKLFRKRKVVGIDSTELIWGLGSFHCISQQEPK